MVTPHVKPAGAANANGSGAGSSSSPAPTGPPSGGGGALPWGCKELEGGLLSGKLEPDHFDALVPRYEDSAAQFSNGTGWRRLRSVDEV